MIIVVDTNIIVSGLLKPRSTSGSILKLILSGKIKLGIDNRILDEYNDVLLREKFGFEEESIDYILEEIEAEGIRIISEPSGFLLPDEDDTPFLEVAVSGNIRTLVTGNKKHFPEQQYKQVKIYSPTEFIKEYNKLIE